MAYNRYRGNSGSVERVEDFSPSPPPAPPLPDVSQPPPPPPPPPPREAARERPRPHSAPPLSPPPHAGPLPGLGAELGKLLRRLSPGGLETEDFLLMGILYLLDRETGDRDFLIMLGGILFL